MTRSREVLERAMLGWRRVADDPRLGVVAGVRDRTQQLEQQVLRARTKQLLLALHARDANVLSGF